MIAVHHFDQRREGDAAATAILDFRTVDRMRYTAAVRKR